MSGPGPFRRFDGSPYLAAIGGIADMAGPAACSARSQMTEGDMGAAPCNAAHIVQKMV